MQKGFIYILFLVCAAFASSGFDPETEKLAHKDTAIIIEKAPNGIVIRDRSFPPTKVVLIKGPSAIIDIDGKRISLKELKIPCRAEISYRWNKNDGEPELKRIKVYEYTENAEKRFTIKDPFLKQPRQ